MNKLRTIFFITCYYINIALCDELILVHALWRHGDRNPDVLIPTDVNNTASTWPQGLGELTPDGMRQEFLLGKAINERYSGKFLSINYSQPEIYMRADDYNRTLMSAMANLAAIYSNSTSGVQVPGWPAPYWQPIPVHTVALSNDNILDQVKREGVHNSLDYENFTKEFETLFNYLDKVCGVDYKINFDNINNIFDPLNAELVHHDEHTWPYYINGTIFELIRQANNIEFEMEYADAKSASSGAGNLLEDIVSRMQQKQTSLTKPKDSALDWVRKLKFYGYSAHDTTVNAFMRTLGAKHYVHGQPGYSSCVLVELWTSNTDEYYVKSFYRQNTSSEFFEIQVGGCPDFATDQCSLSDFNNRSIPFFPVSLKEECGPLGMPSTAQPMKFNFFVIIAMVLITLIRK